MLVRRRGENTVGRKTGVKPLGTSFLVPARTQTVNQITERVKGGETWNDQPVLRGGKSVKNKTRMFLEALGSVGKKNTKDIYGLQLGIPTRRGKGELGQTNVREVGKKNGIRHVEKRAVNKSRATFSATLKG